MKARTAITRLSESEILKTLAGTVAFAILTGAFSQIKVYLPWTPVPITLQTAAVLLAGALLGRKSGALSQLIYVALGAAGIPWFANLEGGIGYLAGPTGGYLVGFILAAYLTGYTFERIEPKSAIRVFAILTLVNFTAIYIPGLIHLYLWLKIVKGSSVSLASLLGMGLLPFVAGDLMKIAAITPVILKSFHSRKSRP